MRILFLLFILLTLATIALAGTPVIPQTIPLKDVLEKVTVAGTPHDGDTLSILAPTVRIVGICAAELKEPDGPAHRNKLIAWLQNSDIYIIRKGESYGRTLARVFKKVDGQFVELKQSDIGAVAGRGVEFCK